MPTQKYTHDATLPGVLPRGRAVATHTPGSPPGTSPTHSHRAHRPGPAWGVATRQIGTAGGHQHRIPAISAALTRGRWCSPRPGTPYVMGAPVGAGDGGRAAVHVAPAAVHPHSGGQAPTGARTTMGPAVGCSCPENGSTPITSARWQHPVATGAGRVSRGRRVVRGARCADGRVRPGSRLGACRVRRGAGGGDRRVRRATIPRWTGFGGGVFGCLLPGFGAGLCGPGRLRVGVRGRHRGGGLPAQVFGLLLDALSFLGQRAALLVEHGLDTFGGISFGGGDALFGVESDVLGFFPGDRVGRDGELGKAYGDEPPRSSRPNPR